ncbi:MAG TPA: DUF362 domain-containing protein [Acidobacteriaceae bacterium]
MKSGYYETSRRDFLKSSVLGSAAALTALQVPAALAAQTAPATPVTFSPSDPANAPIGTAFGVKPGRVAWAHDAKATSWDGVTNAPGWWDDSNTHPDVVARLLSTTIRSVGDAPTDKAAWKKIFTDFNKRSGNGTTGYRKGEKIVVKLNLNQVHDHGNGANASYIAPQLVQSLLRQLVQQAGAAPADIAFYDAIRDVPSTIFDRCKQEYPGVRFIDGTGTDGREKAVPDKAHPLVFAKGGLTFYLPTCVTEAAYMINVAGLKGHTMAGMTVTAKNHQGTILTADGGAGARSVHPFLAVKSGGRVGNPAAQGMASYNGLVDMNAHPHVGPKTVLYLIDALYATRHNEFRLAAVCKWQSEPFNGHWTSSIFASQDGVALDSVALDFLRNEPTLAAIVTGAVDNYLHEMALAHQPPSGVTYDPAKAGKPLASLGVHEHWNNPAERKYTRNLGKGDGIELVKT